MSLGQGGDNTNTFCGLAALAYTTILSQENVQSAPSCKLMSDLVKLYRYSGSIQPLLIFFLAPSSLNTALQKCMFGGGTVQEANVRSRGNGASQGGRKE